jgi:PAS domain S-box-containing protein
LSTLRKAVDLGSRISNQVLHILNLEDDPLDTQLIRANLTEGGISCEISRVASRTDFEDALQNGDFDLVLSDYSLPSFDGISALKLANEIRPDVPFILVSGAIGEERAIEALKDGATDYVLKRRLERLVPAVRRAVREAEERSERKHLQEALRMSDQQLRTLVEQIPAVTYTQKIAEPGTSTTNLTLYASPQIESQTGYPPQAFVEDSELWIKLLHPEDRERVLAEDRRTDETGEPFRMEYRQIDHDGRTRWIRDEAVLVRDEEGLPRIWQGVMFDITERKEAEQKQRESEQRFRQLFEQSVDALFVYDEIGHIVDCNSQACRLLGYSREELLGLSVQDVSLDILTEERSSKERGGGTPWQRALAGEPGMFSFSTEGEGVRKEGTAFAAEVRVGSVDYAGRRMILASVRDITERRRTEEALWQSERRFRAIFERASTGIVQIGLDGELIRFNDRFCEILGYTREELPTVEFRDILVPEDLERGAERSARSMLGEEGRNYSEGKLIRRKDGSWAWIHLTVSLIYSSNGPEYFAAVIEDITERKKAEKALTRSEILYRTVVEQTTENIFLVDLKSKRILEANAALQHSLGYGPEELYDMTLYDIVAHDRESIDENTKRIAAEGHYFVGERSYRRKDGTLVDVEVSAGTVPYEGRDAMAVVAHNIAERKKAEENLRRSLSVLLALREAGQVLGSTLSSEEIVVRLLEIMRGVSRLTTVVLSVQDDDGELRIWRSAGLEGLQRRARFKQEAEAARRATLEDEEHRAFRLPSSGSEDSRLVGLCLPLRIKDRVVGVLEAYGEESLTDAEPLEILSSLSSQAASALENAWLYEELEERQHALQDLVGKLLGAQEEERRRVAYEVHDGLAQVAVAAHQHLQAFARRYSPDAVGGRRDLERILRLVRATVSDARQIIANLRPTTLDDLGLAATLSLEVERLREEGYWVDYEANLGDERLPETVEISLFRVGQETLTNVRKHARTQRVRVTLERSEDEVRFEVQDFGRGFDATEASAGSGPGERVGLAGMRERIGMLGGELEIHSTPGVGTSVVAIIPLE